MKLFAACYTGLHKRRRWLVLFLLLLAVGSVWNLSRLKIEESIVAMLPDGKSLAAKDFELLTKAPFARKLIIHLRAAPGAGVEKLLVATDGLRASLPGELFSNPVSGPKDMGTSALMSELGDYLPSLLDRKELRQIAGQLNPERVDASLAADVTQLLQPQGIALKNKIRRDPLDLQRFALQKLRFLNPFPGVRVDKGHFLSRDGRSSLILADTPVLMTDAAGGRKLLDAFHRAQGQLPAGISAELLSGHPYTVANAETIQGDLRVVLLASAVGILVVFVVFLRSLRALPVFLLPLFSMAAALVMVSLWFDKLSGITIGFGAVLLGITIDFGLHVYFALQLGDNSRPQLLQAVSRPVLFGGLTTLAAFSVLLRSELPGQRQLAVFAIAGITAALLLALLVLPHFIGKREENTGLGRANNPASLYTRSPGLRWFVLLSWVGIAGFCAFAAQGLRINGELRQLGYMPQELQKAEKRLAEVWGGGRNRALIFASGADLDMALQRNEQVWQSLVEHEVQDESVSLAPLLASRQTKRQRVDDWQVFWRERRATTEHLIRAGGQKYGFSSDAFSPFFSGLDNPPKELDIETLQRWGLGRLLDNLLLKDNNSYQLVSLVPDRPELISRLESELATLPGVTLVSQTRFGKELSREIGIDFSRFIIFAGLGVVLLLLVLFRRLPEVFLALLPVVTGLVVMFGAMTWMGLELNLFNGVASILIIGLGVDYGIFMVCHDRHKEYLASSRAIIVSGLTTLVGFGALVLARHPALHSIGLTVLLGISASVPTAVLVIPAFQKKAG